MEALCYSFLDCADRHFSNSFLRPSIEFEVEDFDPKDQERSFANLRRSRLQGLRTEENIDHFPNSIFVTLFFSFFDKLSRITDDLNEYNYSEFRRILSSFISKED